MTAPTTPSPERQPDDAGGGLLPCPWCGGKAKCNELRRGNYRRTGDNYQVVCNKCRARGPLVQDSAPSAIAAWNRRTPAPQAQPDARAVEAPAYVGMSYETRGPAADAERRRMIEDRYPAASAPAADDGWRPIESAPQTQKEMFVVQAFGVVNGFTGPSPYTSDPVCVWAEDGEFMRWPHNFSPTHWRPLPAPPVALHPAAPTDEVGKS